MKRKIYLLAILCAVVFSAYSQFVAKPLNYQVSGDFYLPKFFSIVDADHVWIGTMHYLSTGQPDIYSYAVHTNDGGDTWIFDSIPAPGQPNISNVSAVDANTCFYTFIDNWVNGSIWKTTDGGATWTQKTTTQFQGGFADFYHAFNAGEGVAVGDPNGGYFEIYRTTDGGDSWVRTDQSNIPSPLASEFGNTDGFSAIGNSIWFATNKGRCYKSTDQGQHWSVNDVTNGVSGTFNVAFSNQLEGVFYDQANFGATVTYFYRTSDGGSTWTIDSLPPGNFQPHVSAVNGLWGGFVVSAADPVIFITHVYFTPDFFSTIVMLDSNLMAYSGGLSFMDQETGWICGLGNDTNDIMKFNGILTSVFNASKAPEKLSVMPNPSSTSALVKIPASLDSKAFQLRIIDMSGREVEHLAIASSTGWTKLNASGYSNGIYIIELLSANQLVARERWVVQH